MILTGEEFNALYEFVTVMHLHDGSVILSKENFNNIKDTLESLADALKRIDESGGEWEAGVASEALHADTPTDYHNPADVAEIKSLKERVDTLSNTVNMLAPAEIGKECRHIEILKQAREALTMWNKNLSCDCDQCKATREALAEIDKTLGGKEDA